VRAHRLERVVGQLDRNVEIAAVPDVDQLALAIDADQQPADVFDRLLRRRQPDALQRPFDERR
jgi:hypothetical protein